MGRTYETTDGREVESLSVTETAVLVRKALRTGFPDVKFSVRSERYSGGASIDVSWTDGPTEREVEAVTNSFRRSDFDGIDDSTRFREPRMVDGRLVRFGTDFVFGHRAHSPGLLDRAAAVWEERHGATYDPDAPGNGDGHLTAREAVHAIARGLSAV